MNATATALLSGAAAAHDATPPHPLPKSFTQCCAVRTERSLERAAVEVGGSGGPPARAASSPPPPSGWRPRPRVQGRRASLGGWRGREGCAGAALGLRWVGRAVWGSDGVHCSAGGWLQAHVAGGPRGVKCSAGRLQQVHVARAPRAPRPAGCSAVQGGSRPGPRDGGPAGCIAVQCAGASAT